MNRQKVVELYGGSPGDWREIGNGAWAHKDAQISDRCRVIGPAVFRGGEFLGGV